MEGVGESGWRDEVQVMSDVHIGCSPDHASCTTFFTISNSSKFLTCNLGDGLGFCSSYVSLYGFADV